MLKYQSYPKTGICEIKRHFFSLGFRKDNDQVH